MSFTLDRSRWSDVYIMVGSRLFASLGTFGTATALLLKLQSGGAGGLAAAALIIVTALPQVVLAPVTGRLADRVDSRLLIVAAGLLESAGCLALTQVSGLAGLLALVFLTSSAGALLQPVLGGLTPSMVTRADLPRANALGQTAGALGMIGGPALSGLLVGSAGVTTALQVNAVTALATVLAGLLIRTRRVGGTADGGTPEAEPARWRLSGDRLLRAVILGCAVAMGAMSAVNVAEVFFVRETLGASETTYGLVSACWAVGMLLGAWRSARMIRSATPDVRLAAGLAATLAGIGLTTVAVGTVTGGAWPLLPLFVVGGACNGALNATVAVLLARRVPEAIRGRAFATFQAVVQAAALIGYGGAGAAMDLATPRGVLLLAGIGGLGSAVVLAGLVRRHRRDRGPRPGPDPACDPSRPVEA